jgi:hypothetical protein
MLQNFINCSDDLYAWLFLQENLFYRSLGISAILGHLKWHLIEFQLGESCKNLDEP